MRDRKTISSTENLLEIIRGNLKREVNRPVPPPPGGRPGRAAKLASIWRGLLADRVGKGAGALVGVELSAEELRLARVAAGSPCRLESLKSFIYPKKITPGDEQFPLFLKSCLQEFGVEPATAIWAALAADRVEVYPLRLPKATGRKDLASVVYWAMQKEKRFEERQYIFDYRVLSEVMDKGVAKLQVICYLAEREAVRVLQRLFRQAGFNLAGVSFEAAAVNNLLRRADSAFPCDSLAHIHIGAENSRIDLFQGREFTFTRNVKTGSNSFLEAIRETAVSARRPGRGGVSGEGEIVLELESPAEEPVTLEEAAAIFQARLEIDSGRAEGGGEEIGEFGPEEVMGFIDPALGRLISQTERTLEYYIRNLGFPKVEKILLSGQSALFPALADYIREQLGLSLETLDPVAIVAPVGPVPTTAADRLHAAVALGLALSDSEYTPNFLHTYKEKAVERKNRLLSRAMAAGVVVAAGLALGGYAYQLNARHQRQAELDRLRVELAQFDSRLNAAAFAELYEEIRRGKSDVGLVLERYKTMALLAEIVAVTPAANIRLYSVQLNSDPAGGGGNLLLAGFAGGEAQMLNAHLTGYIVRLQASNLLEGVKVQQTSEESHPELGAVLKFTISLRYS